MRLTTYMFTKKALGKMHIILYDNNIDSSLTLVVYFEKYCKMISSFHLGSLNTCKSFWSWEEYLHLLD